MPVPCVDIVVVSYYSSAQLTGLLAGLPEQYPVTVVDNAEDVDRDTQRVCEEARSVTYIPLRRNLGFGHGCNVGAGYGRAPFILFVNPDCRIEAQVIDTLRSTLECRPDVAACAPLLMAGDSRRRQIFGGAAPRPLTALGYLALPDRLLGRWCIWATTTRSRCPVEVDWLSGACLMVRREAFEAVNGFREDLFMYNEDIDLCARLRRDGWGVVLDPRATGRHTGGKSSGVGVDVPRLWSRSTLRYIGVSGRSWRSILLAVLLLGGMWRRHLVARLRGRTGATFAPQFAAELFTMLGTAGR